MTEKRMGEASVVVVEGTGRAPRIRARVRCPLEVRARVVTVVWARREK